MKWLWMLLKNPADALDWWDTADKLDHGKVMADIVILSMLAVTLVVALHTGLFPPAYMVVALIAGGMGPRIFLALIRSKSITTQETVKYEFGVPSKLHDDGEPCPKP